MSPNGHSSTGFPSFLGLRGFDSTFVGGQLFLGGCVSGIWGDGINNIDNHSQYCKSFGVLGFIHLFFALGLLSAAFVSHRTARSRPGLMSLAAWGVLLAGSFFLAWAKEPESSESLEGVSGLFPYLAGLWSWWITSVLIKQLAWIQVRASSQTRRYGNLMALPALDVLRKDQAKVLRWALSMSVILGFIMTIPSLRAEPLGPLGGPWTHEIRDRTAFDQVILSSRAFDLSNSVDRGRSMFRQMWQERGPVFNAPSCLACHARNARGLPLLPENRSVGLLFRLTDGQGQDDPILGHQLNVLALAGVPREAEVAAQGLKSVFVYPDGSRTELVSFKYNFSNLSYGELHDSTIPSPRNTPNMIGLGLLEGVPNDVMERLADPLDLNHDGISGRLGPKNREGLYGRFGWTSAHSSLMEQNAAALHFDIGVKSSLHSTTQCSAHQEKCQELDQGPLEVTDTQLQDLTRYTRALGVPRQRNPQDSQVIRGLKLFEQVGCVQCHVKALQTLGPPEFSGDTSFTIHPFSDLLLHDMGPDLAVWSRDKTQIQREWRTAPLWGLGLEVDVVGRRYLLHDGRARTPEEAILWHGGEALASRDRFAALSTTDRARILQFLETL